MSAKVGFSEVVLVVLLLLISLAVALIARRLRFPYTLALVLVGLAFGLFGVLPGLQFSPDLVLFLFLPALLFEGAWSLDTEGLRTDWLAVLLLAVPGLLIALGTTAVIVHLGTGVPLLVALLLGAIVSPTDPVAVVALLRQLHMPVRLRTIIEGESLFNDGVGSAAYTVVLGILQALLHLPGDLGGLSSTQIVFKTLWLFIGGPLLGFTLGFVVSRAQQHVDDHVIETSITFSLAYGSYILGVVLGTSGLLTVVAAGLTMGGYGRRVSMSRRTRLAVDDIWEFTGYVANSLLFLLLGHEIGAASLASAVPAIGWAVVGVLVGRTLMVYLLLPAHDALARRLPVHRDAGRSRPERPTSIPLLWRPLIVLSGLRGALSIALALSLPTETPYRSLLEYTVYGVVLVTLVGQGAGLRLLLPRWPKSSVSGP
jgi:CPA1 family monovalent cation:H+ antiporter